MAERASYEKTAFFRRYCRIDRGCDRCNCKTAQKKLPVITYTKGQHIDVRCAAPLLSTKLERKSPMELVNIFHREAKEVSCGTKESVSPIRYQTLFILFMLGSVLGFFVEGVCHIFKAGIWESHSAVIWGPFCIIYGIGAVAVYLLSCRLSLHNIFYQFAAFTFSGAVIEYVSSLFQEICFGSVSWDYSDHFMNIGGRVSLQMALFWGALGVVFIYFIFPVINGPLNRIHGKALNVACILLSIFMAVNLIVTVSALVRWQQRQNDIPATSTIGEALDKHFNDADMAKLYPNMRFQ